MNANLGALSRLVATPARQTSAETVLAACEQLRTLLRAEDAYVIRAGDPAFIRMGCDDDPGEYEIKQRGYWRAWREAVGQPAHPVRLLTVRNRIVEGVAPLDACVAATHIAAILPGADSNSEVLIVRGPWPQGLTEDEIEMVNVARPMLAYLVANVLDAERQDRLRSQMRVLADIAEAFSHSDEHQNALGALAGALAGASGFAWVAILLFDPALERILDRALNTSRHSDTQTAAQGRQGRESENSAERDIEVARHVAWTRQPYCVPDVSDPNEQFLVNDELRPYYEKAHVISMASFPVFVQDQMLATITFCGSEPHEFGDQEVDFLWSLVAQAGPTIKAFRLNSELREAEQRLRAVFTNAPVFITVFGADGTILLSEGAGLGRLGQVSGALVGSSVYDAMPEAFHEMLRHNIARGLNGESFDANLHLNGRDFQTRYAALRDEDGTPSAVIGVTMDITEQVTAERELRKLNEELHAAKEEAESLAREAEASRQRAEYLAGHDPLTGVLSRRAWFDVAKDAEARALAVFDIDMFKSFNDRYGHPVGDVVLTTVAGRLAGAVHGHGIIGRLGGEEFGVVFTGALEEVRATCQAAVDAVAALPCVVFGGIALTVTVSAGLAELEGAGEEAVLRAYTLADTALYQAKKAGRHRMVVAKAA